MLSAKRYGYAARVSAESRNSNVAALPSAARSTTACSKLRAMPWRPILHGPATDCAHPPRSDPTIGNSTGARRAQNRGSPCHKYSRPSSCRLESCAPSGSMAAATCPPRISTSSDMQVLSSHPVIASRNTTPHELRQSKSRSVLIQRISAIRVAIASASRLQVPGASGTPQQAGAHYLRHSYNPLPISRNVRPL